VGGGEKEKKKSGDPRVGKLVFSLKVGRNLEQGKREEGGVAQTKGEERDLGTNQIGAGSQ